MTPQRLRAARVAYVAVILLATAPVGFSLDPTAAAVRLARAFSLPLWWRDVIDGVRNIVLFAGLGSVWVATSLSGELRREVRSATVCGLVLSATVEGLQCFSAFRTASIVDVATNTAGAFAGAAGLTLIFVGLRGTKGARSYLGAPAMLVAGSYGLAALCEALTPLFGSLPLRIEGGPINKLRDALGQSLPLSIHQVPYTDIPLFAVAGFLGLMFLAEQDRVRRVYGYALSASALVVGAHLAHGLFNLAVRWEAAITDVLGLGLGAWAAHRWLAPLSQGLRGATRAGVAIVGYMVVLVLWGWRPFLPVIRLDAIATQLQPVNLIPLMGLFLRSDVFSAVHVTQQFLLYVPLGALLAVWPLRRSGRWSHLWPGLWFALIVELGHLTIVDRWFDVTNALIAWAGLGVGWVLMRRSGFTPYGEAFARPLPRGA